MDDGPSRSSSVRGDVRLTTTVRAEPNQSATTVATQAEPAHQVEGRDASRDFARVVFERQPPERKRFRSGFFTDGRTLMWEYPRAAPDGEQMDFVEVMEIDAGLIRHHRVYWGWYGLRLLERGAG